MSLIQALAIAVIVGLAYLTRRIGGDPQFERPIVLGPIVGIILGDLESGVVVGGTLELIFIGAAAIGGTAPPNVAIGTAVGTAFAIQGGQGPEAALVAAVPAAVVGTFFELFAKGSCSFLVHRADNAATTGRSRGILTTIWIGNAIHFFAYAVPTFLALYFSSSVVKSVTDALSGDVENALNTAAAILPAVGFGILLAALYSRRLFPVFIAGFVIAAYTNFTVIGVAVLTVAVVLVVLRPDRAEPAMAPPGAGTEAGDVVASNVSGEGSTGVGLATRSEERREIRQLVWRSLLLQASFNYERFQNMGFWWMMRPVLDRAYPTPTERAEAYSRHLVYFNTHPWVVGPIAGIVATMEKRRAHGDDSLDDEAITSVKVGMMAPLAGIGDSLVFGALRPVMSGVCAALAIDGNLAGPVLFIVSLLAVQAALRIYGVAAGYRQGTRFFERLAPAQIDRLKTGAAIVGLAVTGGLVATLLTLTTPLTYHRGETSISLQDSLDQVLPALLPLTATLVVFLFIRRRVSPTWVLLGTAVVGLVAGFFGVLA